MSERRPDTPYLFTRDVNDRIIPEAINHKEFLTIRKWRVLEKIKGTQLTINIRNKQSGIDIDFNYTGSELPSDVSYMIKETINKDFINEKLNLDRFYSITIFGNVVGESVSSDYKALDRHYFVVEDVAINNTWLSVNNIKDFCNDFELEFMPDFGIYNLDFKKYITCYQNVGLDKFFGYIADSLMNDVAEYDEQNGIETISKFGERKDCYFPCHGIIGRSEPQVYNQKRQRIQFKLLTNDLNNFHNFKKSIT